MKVRYAIAVAAILVWGVAIADDGVKWDNLNEDQQKVLNLYADGWNQLEPERQKRLSVGADRWTRMSDNERRDSEQRFKHWLLRPFLPQRQIPFL